MPQDNRDKNNQVISDNRTIIRQYVINVPSGSTNASVVSNKRRNFLRIQNNGPDAVRYCMDRPCQGLRAGDMSLPVGVIHHFDGNVPSNSIYFACDYNESAAITILEGAAYHE